MSGVSPLPEQSTKFIMAEFKKRKGKATIPKKREEESDLHVGFAADCPLDDPGNDSIAKLGWRVRLACYKQLHEVLETNHVNGYLEQPEKAAVCEEEVRVAASNLEKVIFDCAKSKISYKAAIINRRKEIITATENFSVHSAFIAEKKAVARRETCPVASGMFQKASALIEKKTGETEEVKKDEKPRELPKFMTTSERLKRLRKPKKEAETKLTKQDQDLITKYLNPAPKAEDEKIPNPGEENCAPVEKIDKKIDESDDDRLKIDEAPPKVSVKPPLKTKTVFQVPRKKLIGSSSEKSERVERLKRLNALTANPPTHINSPAQKRKVSELDGADSAAKRVRSDSPKKSVRFDPSEKTDGTGSDGKKDYIPNDLESCKKLVIKIISPYFNAGRFGEKTFFKELAKRVTKSLVQVT